GARAGDVVLECLPGWRFSDPHVLSNPIPGNHGHGVTLPIPFFISGGSPALAAPHVSDEPALSIDVAPTIASWFGLRAPQGGWDGKARTGILR
ncbi:MAG: alkaline phosphatase family protein, partial [Rhodococcus sp.]|nr:alkaline phosphatase family protein [Rhodococcus sp. (in: high G+C Gram-positive bacteria)]